MQNLDHVWSWPRSRLRKCVQAYIVWISLPQPINKVTCYVVSFYRARQTINCERFFSRITISLSDYPHLCNAIIAIIYSCFPDSIFTCMANYWPVVLETWVEVKRRDILQVYSVANLGGKKFLNTWSVYQNFLFLYHVFSNELKV